jgi:hypothetical protein
MFNLVNPQSSPPSAIWIQRGETDDQPVRRRASDRRSPAADSGAPSRLV